LILFICFSLSGARLLSQDNWWKDKKYKSEEKQKKFNNCKLVFINISDGLIYNNVTYITPYLQNDVYLSIQNSEKGYYSREQCTYIIESFLNNNPVSSFKWRSSSRSENYAFATGKYKYKKNGFINTYTFSVSLKYINNLWLIDQIIVN
jgi:hypothetical protein